MYNEMLNVRSQKVRNLYKNLDNWLSNQNINALMRQSIKAEELFRKVGITFNVYGEDEAEEPVKRIRIDSEEVPPTLA